MINVELYESTLRECLQTYLNPSHQDCVLRPDFYKPHLRPKYLECLEIPQLIDFAQICLQLVHDVLIAKSTERQSSQFQILYWKIFSELQQPKDELISFILILVWFLIHCSLYKLAQGDDRNKYDYRFMYNVYHILIYYANGVYVSDEFVKIQIDNYLSSRYLDYRLNYYQKKNLKLKLQLAQKSTLFPQMNPPDISQIPGGAQFQRDIRNKRKLKKPQELQDTKSSMEDLSPRYAQTSRFPSTIKFDLRQLSPPIGQLVNQQTVSPKKNFVTHQVISSQLTENFNISQAMKSLQESRTQETQTRVTQKAKSQKLLDLYKVPQPPLEYFKKHPKIDHLFKDMLEMKLVLEQSRMRLEEQQRVRDDGTQIRERIQLILKDKHDNPQDYEMRKHFKHFEDGIASQVASTILPMTQNTSRRPSGSEQLKSPRMILNGECGSQRHVKHWSLQLKSPQQSSSNIKGINEFGYEDHRKEYIGKYSKYSKEATVDTKINDLQHSLMVKQHLIQRSTKKNKS